MKSEDNWSDGSKANLPFQNLFFEAALNNSNYSIWVVNQQFELVLFNQYALTFFKKAYQLTLTTSKSFIADMPLNLMTLWQQRLSQAMQNETFTIFDTLSVPEGEIYIEVNFKPVVNGSEVIGVACQAKDITEQKLKEDSLRESEEKFRKVFDNAHVAISIQTKDRILLVNRNWEKLTGYTSEEAKSLSPISLVHPDNQQFITKLNSDKIYESPGSKNYEFHLLTRHNEEKWVELQASSIVFEGQQAILLVGSDVTHKKEKDKLLQKLSAAVTHSPTSIVITTMEAKIEYVNPYFCTFTGYSYEEVIGQDPKILKSGNTPVEVYRDMWDTLLSKKVWGGEFENRKKNGDLYWESARIAPLLDEKGEITHFIAIKEDITNLKNTQKNLEASKKELLDLNAKKDKFFSIIAHDLRSPFLGLVNLTELLHNNFDNLNPDKTRHFLRLLNESSQQVFQLLENLLEWSKTQTGRIEFNPATIKLTDLINDSIRLVQLNARQKEITIKNQVAPTLFVTADRNMLQTIIRNLLGNAIKYTPKGGLIKIEASEIHSGQNMTLISVIDNGIGIAIEKQNKIFKIGENYSTPGTESEKGTGLGLIICKEFVEIHHGKIWCESDGTNGTTFSFTVPSFR